MQPQKQLYTQIKSFSFMFAIMSTLQQVIDIVGPLVGLLLNKTSDIIVLGIQMSKIQDRFWGEGNITTMKTNSQALWVT